MTPIRGDRPVNGHLAAVPFSEIERGRVEWLDPGRVPIGGVTVLFGDPGLGKSQWTCLLAARLSRGELGPPAASLMLSAEDDTSRTIRPRLEAAGATLELVHCVRSERSEGFVLPDDAPDLEHLIAAKRSRLVTIDPISAHLASLNTWRDSDVRSALRPLAEIAERHSCAIVVVMHMNKASGAQAIYRAGGSIGFVGAARSGLLFARDPDDPDGETGRRRALSHVKSNLSAEASTLVYEVQTIVLPARAGEPESESSRLHLIGESSRTGRDLLTFADDEDRGPIDEAMEFLRNELAAGPKGAQDIFKAAKAEGISEKTLRRAQKQLGIKPQRAGFPSRSYWSLTHGQLPWPSVETENGGQVWGNPHEQTASGPSEGPSDSTHGQYQKVAKCGVPESEQQVIDELERAFLPGGAQWVE